MKSFYVLELSVAPGGARKSHFFVYNNLADIKSDLETDLRLDFVSGAGLLYCYGETVTLLTYINGIERQRINLLPFLSIQGADGTNFKLNDNAQPLAVTKDYVCNEEFLFTAAAKIDWEAAAVLELTGELLQSGEQADVITHPEDGTQDTLDYGFNDLEFGMTEAEYRAQLAEFDAGGI